MSTFDSKCVRCGTPSTGQILSDRQGHSPVLHPVQSTPMVQVQYVPPELSQEQIQFLQWQKQQHQFMVENWSKIQQHNVQMVQSQPSRHEDKHVSVPSRHEDKHVSVRCGGCGTYFPAGAKLCAKCGRPPPRNAPEGPPCFYCSKPLQKHGAIVCVACGRRQPMTRQDKTADSSLLRMEATPQAQPAVVGEMVASYPPPYRYPLQFGPSSPIQPFSKSTTHSPIQSDTNRQTFTHKSASVPASARPTKGPLIVELNHGNSDLGSAADALSSNKNEAKLNIQSSEQTDEKIAEENGMVGGRLNSNVVNVELAVGGSISHDGSQNTSQTDMGGGGDQLTNRSQLNISAASKLDPDKLNPPVGGNRPHQEQPSSISPTSDSSQQFINNSKQIISTSDHKKLEPNVGGNGPHDDAPSNSTVNDSQQLTSNSQSHVSAASQSDSENVGPAGQHEEQPNSMSTTDDGIQQVTTTFALHVPSILVASQPNLQVEPAADGNEPHAHDKTIPTTGDSNNTLSYCNSQPTSTAAFTSTESTSTYASIAASGPKVSTA